MGVSNVIFLALLCAAGVMFALQVRQIRANILLGRPEDRSDRPKDRWMNMIRVALGQSKMVKRPVAGVLHILVYVGFVIINLEVLEIVIDGITGSHRILSFLGGFYDFLIASFEILAILVLISCLVFLVRRNILRIKRFHHREMEGWPANDANLILLTEVFLMSAFLMMNAADYRLQGIGIEGYSEAGAFPISGPLSFILVGWSSDALILLERACWWFHIVGIFAFLNYLPISKHFHIILAFPNTYYANLNPKGQFSHLKSVEREVRLMMDPNADPYATPAPAEGEVPTFGAKDITDLSWKQLMDSYTCTECGRCSDNCPANATGKLLSPRAIVMGVRDRLDLVGKLKKQGKDDEIAQGSLFDHIEPEEVWACTTCNACVDACPVNIDPLSVILDLRRYLVMEQSQPPQELATMFTNVENNGAPWQFAQADRFKWSNEMNEG